MADVLSTELTLQIKAVLTETLDLGKGYNNLTLILDDILEDGVTIDKADLLWHDERTVTAAAETLDLTALTYTCFGSTITVNNARVKLFALWNKSTTAGEILTIGSAAANPWTAVWSGTTIVRPNGRMLFWAPDATGYVTAGGSKNVKVDPGAATITYRIAIVGASS